MFEDQWSQLSGSDYEVVSGLNPATAPNQWVATIIALKIQENRGFLWEEFKAIKPVFFLTGFDSFGVRFGVRPVSAITVKRGCFDSENPRTRSASARSCVLRSPVRAGDRNASREKNLKTLGSIRPVSGLFSDVKRNESGAAGTRSEVGCRARSGVERPKTPESGACPLFSCTGSLRLSAR